MIETIILAIAILGWFLYDNTLKLRIVQAKKEQSLRDLQEALAEYEASYIAALCAAMVRGEDTHELMASHARFMQQALRDDV